MTYYVIKIAITVIIVVIVSELAKRSSMAGAILASVPLISVLAMVWLYAETRDVAQVSSLSRSILWLVLPSLALFAALPVLLERGVNFYTSLTVSIGITIAAYFGMIMISRYFGLRL